MGHVWRSGVKNPKVYVVPVGLRRAAAGRPSPVAAISWDMSAALVRNLSASERLELAVELSLYLLDD